MCRAKGAGQISVSQNKQVDVVASTVIIPQQYTVRITGKCDMGTRNVNK